LIFYVVEVGSSSSEVVKSITSSTCVKKEDIGIKTEVRTKLYTKFDENNVIEFMYSIFNIFFFSGCDFYRDIQSHTNWGLIQLWVLI